MNIILADDEKLARKNLTSMLFDLDFPINILEEAKNGEELLPLIEKHQPDLVFVDIRMPKLDGIEAIRIGKTLSPRTKWIVMSGYSEFAYARDALKLGITHYLVKPVPPSELEQAVRQVKAELETDSEQLAQKFQYEVMAALHGSISQDTINNYTASLMSGCRFSITLLDVFPSTQTLTVAEQAEVVTRLTSAHQHVMRPLQAIAGIQCCLIHLPESWTLSVFAWTPDCEQPSQSLLTLYNTFLRALLDDYSKRQLPIYALQAAPCLDAVHLPAVKQQLGRMMFLLLLLPPGQLHQCSTLERNEGIAEQIELARRFARLCHLYMKKQYVEYMKHVAGLEHIACSALKPPTDWDYAARYMNQVMGTSLDGSRRGEWGKQLHHAGESLLQRMSDRHPELADPVELAVLYVDQHYMNDIGIGQIATEIGVTPNYLSALFHKRKGITFTKYVVQIRMLKAKELLLTQPHLQIQKVGEQVGYYSARHFTKLFTQHFGQYPSEMREETKL